jgi:hypothetical protein
MYSYQKSAVIVLGYNMEKNNSEIISYDRAKRGIRIFTKNLDPKHDLFINAGKPYEIAYLQKLERELAQQARVGLNLENFKQATSNNTFENAIESLKILQARDVTKAYIVTSPDHMDRAYDIFEQQRRAKHLRIVLERSPSKLPFLIGLSEDEQKASSDYNYKSRIQNSEPLVKI